MKKRILILTLALAIIAGIGFGTAKLWNANAALPEIEVDTDDYPLYVSDTPYGISDASCIYAQLTKYGKLSDANEDVYSEFELQLVDDDEYQIKLRNAMAAAGINPDQNRAFAMKATLYRYDEEEGENVINKESTIKLLTPVSDNMYQEDADGDEFFDEGSLMVVTLTSAGALRDITSSCRLVYADEIASVEMTITSDTIYGFILKDVPPTEDEQYEHDPVATATPTPAQPDNSGTTTPTPVVTSTPTPTPTPATNPNGNGGSGSNGSGNGSGNGGKSNTNYDSTPKTGDMHNSFVLIAGAGLCLLVIIGAVKKLKKI